MSNLEYVDLDYGVRFGYETKGEGLDGEHDFRIIQFPLSEAIYHEGSSMPTWRDSVWSYGGTPAKDPFLLQEIILTNLFDMHVSSRLPAIPTSVWFVEMEDEYTIRGWQA